MNLNYKILWYDDDMNFFESVDKESIESEIQSWGFQPRIVPVHNVAELQHYAPSYDQFDMLVVDFMLGGGEQGDRFIRSVRDQQVYAEVIFYSAAPSSELWKAVHDQQLEGIYITNKPGINQKLLRVAEQSVKKVLDLENMRGIVMSEVGDLDLLLEAIFSHAMSGIDEVKQGEVFKGFVEKSREPDVKLAEAITAFEKDPSIEKLLHLCDTSDKRLQNYNRVRRHHPVLKGKNFSTDYQREILGPRNFLAHGVPKKMEDDSFLFQHRDKEYVFNDVVSRELRKKILAYKRAFEEILDALAPQFN